MDVSSKFKYALGENVQDKVSGFTGIVMARCDSYLTDYRSYQVQSFGEILPRKMPEEVWLAEDRLRAMAEEPPIEVTKDPGTAA
jgi:hypothetical protein